MYKKSFSEKIGDLLDHTGKRFLIGLAGAVLGGCLGTTCKYSSPFLSTVGILFCMVSAYVAMSVIKKNKTYFVAGISVRLSNGDTVPCVIVKQKCYAHMPIIPFFCIFFYVPYKTQYYLIRNMAIPAVPAGERVDDAVLRTQLLPSEPLTHAKAKALIDDPQIITGELDIELVSRREQFFEDIKPFLETGLIEEICHTNQVYICKLMDSTHLVFHYSGYGDNQVGFRFNGAKVEEVEKNPGVLSDYYLRSGKVSDGLVALNDRVLERLLRESDKEKTEAVEKAQVKLNSNKKILTKDAIRNALTGKGGKGRLIWGCILLYGSLYSLMGAIYAIANAGIAMAVIMVAVTALQLYFGICNIRKHKGNRAKARADQYRIVKTACTAVVDLSDSDGPSYRTEFANGEVIMRNAPMCVVGDQFYMVYLEGDKHPRAYYSEIEYVPADDLVIE